MWPCRSTRRGRSARRCSAATPDYLERKIEWDSVRESLRQSIGAAALAPGRRGCARRRAPEQTPSLWQRLKTASASVRSTALSTITSRPRGCRSSSACATPIARCRARRPRSARSRGTSAQAEFWSRLKRAEFKSPTAFEVEMADRNDPNRHFIGLLELRGAEWKLTDLRVRMVARRDRPRRLRRRRRAGLIQQSALRLDALQGGAQALDAVGLLDDALAVQFDDVLRRLGDVGLVGEPAFAPWRDRPRPCRSPSRGAWPRRPCRSRPRAGSATVASPTTISAAPLGAARANEMSSRRARRMIVSSCSRSALLGRVAGAGDDERDLGAGRHVHLGPAPSGSPRRASRPSRSPRRLPGSRARTAAAIR